MADPTLRDQELIGWDTNSTGLYKKDFKLDSSTGRFKVPADGKYIINAGVVFRLAAGAEDEAIPTTGSNTPHLKVHVIRKGTNHTLFKAAGSFVVTGADAEGGVLGANGSGVFCLKKGDYLNLVVDLDPAILADATLTVTADDTRFNYFSVQRLH